MTINKLSPVSQCPNRGYRDPVFFSGFKQWLQLKNYDKSSVYYDPVRLGEFLEFVFDSESAVSIEQITPAVVESFFHKLSKKRGKRTGEVLSLATLRNYLTVVNRFSRYVSELGLGSIEVPVHFKGGLESEVEILSKVEIQKIYRSISDDIYGLRDRAMLGVYYGCGLRRSEGASLLVQDIMFDKQLIYVRNGKGNKSRYVPMVGRVKRDILDYVQLGRPLLLNKNVSDYLFIGRMGKPMQSYSLYQRFKQLLKKAGIEKQMGLHGLRHTIATHLLLGGMSLVEVGKFLGHVSLESTQLYTHISKKHEE